MRIVCSTCKTKLLAGILASSFIVPVALAQASSERMPATVGEQAQQPRGSSPLNLALAEPSASSSRDWAARNNLYFKRNWGVEIVGVKPVTSGYMLAFRYRIVDPEKARMLNDRKSKAYLIDEATGIRLAVPAMEKVGELRSGSLPEADRTYFMVFGNPGKLVKSGSRVTLVVGNFRAENLIVN
jgi:hypothetical protein